MLDARWEDKDKTEIKERIPAISITTEVEVTELEDWIWDAVFLNPVSLSQNIHLSIVVFFVHRLLNGNLLLHV